MSKKTKEALIWITELLRKNKIPFVISGGFDAKILGAHRALADLDIYVSDKNIFKLAELTKEYTKHKAKRYKDKNWDLILLTLKYKGQLIDICGATSQKIFNKTESRWISQRVDLSKFTKKKVYGLILPFMPMKDLINYKKKLLRRVDFYDLKYLVRIISKRR